MQPVEPLLITWVQANFAVQAGIKDPEELATLVATTPFVKILRIGGPSGFTLDEPRVDWEIYTQTELASAILAGQIRDALMYTLQTYSASGASFGRPHIELEPMWRPYADINAYCYGMTTQLYVHH